MKITRKKIAKIELAQPEVPNSLWSLFAAVRCEGECSHVAMEHARQHLPYARRIVADLKAGCEHGHVTGQIEAATKKMWPDYEEGEDLTWPSATTGFYVGLATAWLLSREGGER